jgi:hypothetical protein
VQDQDGQNNNTNCKLIGYIIYDTKYLTNSMAYGTQRFNATFTRASNNPYP